MYQIAKSLTIFNVQECVVLEVQRPAKSNKKAQETQAAADDDNKNKNNKLSDAVLISSLLQYFITPPYLRNIVFKNKFQQYFHHASKLPKLSVLPYMRVQAQEPPVSQFREGVSIPMQRPVNGKKVNKQTKYVCIGKKQPVELKGQLVPTNVRVTVDTATNKIVSPHDAYGKSNVGVNASYGYGVRVVTHFNDIFTQMPVSYEQSLLVSCGDFYGEDQVKMGKLATLKTTREGNVLVILGRWDRLQSALQPQEGVSSINQFLDGQWPLPATVPAGHLATEDALTIALTTLQPAN